MTPDDWRRINEVFNAVLDRPSAERESYLRAVTASDPDTAEEVRRMLAAHAESGPLDRPAWLAETAQAFHPGHLLAGRYRILRLLGRGGMGEVYEAEDLEIGEHIALKTLLPATAGDVRMIARFKQELQLSRRVSHPNVCRVYDLARHPADGSSSAATYFLTMELLPGERLSEKLRRDGPLTPADALPLLRQIAAALDAAHAAGVIHRDLKPSNIMLAADGHAVVTDFGLARSFQRDGNTATRTSQLMGTFDYMAPELFQGRPASAASDVYALGVVAARMVSGECRLPEDAGLPPAWGDAIRRATDPDPRHRFTSAGAFLEALEGRRRLRLPRGRVLAAAFVMLAILAAVWLTLRPTVHQPPAEALAFYNRGVENIHAGAFFAATRALQEALRLDPEFALAHARMAEAWVELQIPERATHEMLLSRRQDLSGLSARDRLLVEAIDLTLTREFAAAVTRYEKLRRPGDPSTEVDLGRACEKANRTREALAAFRRATRPASHNAGAWLRLAVQCSRQGLTTEAASAFQRAEELYKMESNLEGLTQLELERGVDANRRSQFADGATHLGNALTTARLAGNGQQETSATLQLAVNAFKQGDAAASERYARQAIATARANQIEGLAVSGMVSLGGAHFRKGQFQEAERIYREALSMAERGASSRMTAYCRLSLASLYDQMHRPADSEREARAALDFYQPGAYAMESNACWVLVGRSQESRQQRDAALVSYSHALEFAEHAQERSGQALALAALGSLQSSRENYPEALGYYQKELQVAADGEASGYAGLQAGEMLWRLGRYDEAQAAFAGAAPPAAKYTPLRWKLERSQAEMALSRQRYAEAVERATRVITEAREDALLRAEAQRVRGLALLGLGRHPEARRDCEAALAGVARLGDTSGLPSARMATLAIAIASGDHARAARLFHELQSALESRPESRWQVLALMSRLEPEYRDSAGQALDHLAQTWGPQAFSTYLTRPDIAHLARPLLAANSARNQ